MAYTAVFYFLTLLFLNNRSILIKLFYLCAQRNGKTDFQKHIKQQKTFTMEQEKKFESVQKTFNYTPKSALSNQWVSLAFGIGMIVVPLIHPFGLRIRRAEILSPGVFSTILIIGGILLLAMVWSDIRKANILAKQGGRITVNGTRITYPTVTKKKIEYESFLISDIEWIKDRDEDNQFVVQLPDKRVIFEIKYFDSADKFDEFRELFG